MDPAQQRPFDVGPWRVEPSRLRLARGTDTRQVTPRAMTVLCCLASARGGVVRKSSLLHSVWGDAVVTEDALTQCIVELRKALGDSARNPALIETIPRVGYRLMPAVTYPSRRLLPWRPSHRSAAVLAVVLVLAGLYAVYRFVSPTHPTRVEGVAVLPFENLSDDASMTYFSEGLAEELLNTLANVPGIHVPARTSSFAFRGSDLDVTDIGTRLGVDAIVEGSVRRQGSRLRVTVQVIDSDDGMHRWSRVFEGETTDLFTLQENIASEVASALGLRPQRNVATTTADIHAYDWYLLGRQRYRDPTSRDRPDQWLERARRCFEEAIERDPEFAAAHVWLARTWLPLLHSTRADEYDESMLAARKAVDRALAIDPALADAYVVRAWIQTNEGEALGVEASLRRALDLEPHHVEAALQLAQFLWRRGLLREAGELIERSHTIDPYNREVALVYANYLGRTGRYPQAAEVLATLTPESSHFAANLACDYGYLVECVRIARQAVIKQPHNPFALIDLAAAYRNLHMDDFADRWIDDALRASGGTDRLESFFAEGAVLMQERGEFDEVLREFDQRIATKPLPLHGRPLPDVYARQVRYATALTFAGRNEAAARAWDRVYEYPEMMTYSDMSARLSRWILAACAYREAGRPAAFERIVSEALEFVRRIENHPAVRYPPLAAQIATFHALLGQTDRALARLSRAVDLGWRDVRPPHPVWSAFRSDSRYQQLMAAVTADVAAQRKQILRLGWQETPQGGLTAAAKSPGLAPPRRTREAD